MNSDYVCLARRDIGDGMCVTVFEHAAKHTLHVGLLDTDSGNYVDGSVRIFQPNFDRSDVNSYADSLVR